MKISKLNTVAFIIFICAALAPLPSLRGEDKRLAEKNAPSPADAPIVSKEEADLEKLATEKCKLLARPTPEWMPKPVFNIPDADANDAAGMKPYTEKIPGTEVTFAMTPIPAGTFTMGSPESEKGREKDESPQHSVKIDPFWMETHEVTWEEYELWGLKYDKTKREAQKIASTPRDKIVDAVAMPTSPYVPMDFGMGKEGTPAVSMTQFAAKVYCRWLSAKTGRYYRLPTEAEWEYACRAGSKTAYSFGDDVAKLGDYGWFTGNSDERYHKVATKKPNAWGLYDMHGNVAEWVLDGFAPYEETKKTAKNPFVQPTTEWNRVVRGGSYDDDPEKLRSAARTPSEKDWKKQDPQIPKSVWYLTDGKFVGFRVIRPLRMPTAEEARKYEVDENQMKFYKEHVIAEANKQ
jgi:formylglycine-generating enzyme required for sulfatase activity